MTDIYFDTLHADTEYLQGMLREKKLTSAQIVQKYFSQINRYDPIINSLISVAPQDVVLHVAKTLDEEREAGKVRSSLHGIPIVLKVRLPIPLPWSLFNVNMISGQFHHGVGSGHGYYCRFLGVGWRESQQELRDRAETY